MPPRVALAVNVTLSSAVIELIVLAEIVIEGACCEEATEIRILLLVSDIEQAFETMQVTISLSLSESVE